MPSIIGRSLDRRNSWTPPPGPKCRVLAPFEFESVLATEATIRWTTDEPSTSGVDYGPTISYGLAVQENDLVTTHRLTLTGLQSDSLYHVRVFSRDNASNETVGADLNFQTLNAAGDSADHSHSYPSPWMAGAGVDMTLRNLPAEHRVQIFSLNGRLIRALMSDGGGRASWDGRSEDGEPVASGLYLVVSDAVVFKVVVLN